MDDLPKLQEVESEFESKVENNLVIAKRFFKKKLKSKKFLIGSIIGLVVLVASLSIFYYTQYSQQTDNRAQADSSCTEFINNFSGCSQYATCTWIPISQTCSGLNQTPCEEAGCSYIPGCDGGTGSCGEFNSTALCSAAPGCGWDPVDKECVGPSFQCNQVTNSSVCRTATQCRETGSCIGTPTTGDCYGTYTNPAGTTECEFDTDCSSNEYCYEGQYCKPQLGTDGFCNRNQQCASLSCTGGQCDEPGAGGGHSGGELDDPCEFDSNCNTPFYCFNDTLCKNRLVNGSTCNSNRMCQSDFCRNGKCSDLLGGAPVATPVPTGTLTCNSFCTGFNQCVSGLTCSTIISSGGWTSWTNMTSQINRVSGSIQSVQSFDSLDLVGGKIRHYAVVGNKLYTRDNISGNWSSWQYMPLLKDGTDLAQNLSSFSSFNHPDGYVVEMATSNLGLVYSRNSSTGTMSEFAIPTLNIGGMINGDVKSFNSFYHPDGYIRQHAVMTDGSVWERNNSSGYFSAWSNVTSSLANVPGRGSITAFVVTTHPEGYLQQYVVRSGALQFRDNAASRCRLESNPSSLTCSQ